MSEEDDREEAPELEEGGSDLPPSANSAAGHRSVWRRSWLKAALASGAAALLFFGGWFAHGAFRSDSPSLSSDKLAAVLFPEEGIELAVRWGDILQRLVQAGVIDLEKFQAAAQRAGSPLTSDQLKLLTKGSDEPFRIDADNAYFVLDVLWALGLANKNTILSEGPLAQRGWERAAGYASTGGWTIGKEPGPQYLATLELIRLTPQQQAVVEEVAFNSYRPCCGNMTAFPDCNHGMAALALAELMASQGASADEILLALKKVSPFWFPSQYHRLALYFEMQGQPWDQVSPQLVMSKDYSSAAGWKQVNAWLEQQGALDVAGSGRGKASGCAP